ncbi:hypothetical protein [Nocardiopsis flavescens]|uniref:hypothetical protein n=1 Tax=Nocardiopsis flavescens TaxID=758803 RepID=UPI00093272F6|nr:hypothetical protein [Nocardiopsis flavescens]
MRISVDLDRADYRLMRRLVLELGEAADRPALTHSSVWRALLAELGENDVLAERIARRLRRGPGTPSAPGDVGMSGAPGVDATPGAPGVAGAVGTADGSGAPGRVAAPGTPDTPRVSGDPGTPTAPAVSPGPAADR